MTLEHLLSLIVFVALFVWVSYLSRRLLDINVFEFLQAVFVFSLGDELKAIHNSSSSFLVKLFRSMKTIVAHTLFLTYHYARYEKRVHKNNKKEVIKKRNSINVYIAIKLSLVIVILDIFVAIFYRKSGVDVNIFNFFNYDNSEFASYLSYALMLFFAMMIIFALSRCLEIFYAFLKDSRDQLSKNHKKGSGLLYYERVGLAMRSYMEIILNYGLIYYCLNYIIARGAEIYLFSPKSFNGLVDSLYFSAITVTTVGYGDIVIDAGDGSIWLKLLKLIPAFEVINGSILIVVSFTIYVSLSIANKERDV
ncbi:MAG: ion channel [Campylobacterales bacterium]